MTERGLFKLQMNAIEEAVHTMLWGKGRKSSGICPRWPGELHGSGDAGGGIPEVGMEKGHCSVSRGGAGALKHVGYNL